MERKCYNTSLKKALNSTPLVVSTVGSQGKKEVKEALVESLDDVMIGEGQMVKIGRGHDSKIREGLITFL